ncbi:MAG: hypothetical protein IPL41_02585 [Micropruina sp.]|nr:hypothetical protein [Micropruina sp.]
MPEPSEALLTLVKCATLDSIEFREISARRVFPQDNVEPPRLDLNTEVQDSSDVDADQREFRYSLRVMVHDAEGEVVVEPLATYHVPAEHSALLEDRHALTEFANEVAVMALIPYARQALADVTQRVFSGSILMPTYQRGQVRFGDGDSDAHQTAE